MPNILDRINQPNDIQTIAPEEYTKLAREIRHFLLEKVSRTGGHLASNLGVVELTMALHLTMHFPEDKLIWDVGHQAYTHKILTGRKEAFQTLRSYQGLSGFPKRKESNCDAFDTGHSSTSISAALGYVKARDLKEENYQVCAVLGDGALSGGMAYEALNNAAQLKSNIIIVLNDNKMSISENVGGMASYLGKIRTNKKYVGLKTDIEEALKRLPGLGETLVDKIKRSKDSIKRLVIPGMLFEDMGITYIGPIDGHNIAQMITAFHSAKQMSKAVIVHVITKKGKGYSLAEKEPSKFHGIEPFYLKSGRLKTENKEETYTNVFSSSIVELAKQRKNLVTICAAMPTGTGLEEFKHCFPKRFFDVGIAEQHAVTFAAGLAAGGLHPIVAVYSTFLQRAYDQILHDVCIGNLPVTFIVDRAGIVGNDGETHQGIFDLSYFNTMPNLTILAPKNKWELKEMLNYATKYSYPTAIRFPRGKVYTELEEFQTPIIQGKSEVIAWEKEIVLLAVGSMVKTAKEVRTQLKEKEREVSLINVRFVKPYDREILDKLLENHHIFVTLEENVMTGGYGQQVSSYFLEKGIKNITHLNISIPDQFVEHGKTEKLKKVLGIDVMSIIEKINQVLGEEKTKE